MSKKEEKEKLNLLELTPIRNYEHTVKEDGLIDVLVPKFKREFFNRFIPKSKSPFIKANLDELGSAVWELMNGETKILDIVKILDERFGEKIAPVNDRVGMFINNLHRNGFIRFKELIKEN
eukprot:TRINITY_DN17388_c0_g1_i1.p2 TRINITY_DN17388_c0_g1~~TRINITY_DN17388_c0_g1_i1.p2  ORF type:complete len:121 (-),score=1.42 TRINITY_DN17388_c0_g1_i1:1458-1820(-)